MSLKTIKVNPIFLSGEKAGFASKSKTRKEKPSGLSLGQSNNIKKKLIARIKNFQQSSKPNTQFEKTKGSTMVDTNSNSINNNSINNSDVFSDSLQFLDNLAKDKHDKKQDRKNRTLKKKQPYNPGVSAGMMNIATELPPELDWNTISPPPIQKQIQQPQIQMQPHPQPQPQPQPIQTPSISQWNAPPQPSYGNLKKGGSKPTYRNWVRTTQKNRHLPIPKPEINILENIDTPIIVNNDNNDNNANNDNKNEEETHNIIINTTEQVPEAIVNNLIPPPSQPLIIPPEIIKPSYKPSLKPKRKRVTRTLKYKLGKHTNGKVSVLIKNSQTRRRIQTEHALLKQKSILDIKNYLRNKNLLKVGSNAPNDVLRHIYEQSILAGQIENKAKDTLIHNYFNDEKK
jgi:hypothetical protein